MSEKLLSDFMQIPDGMDADSNPYVTPPLPDKTLLYPFGVDMMSQALPQDASALDTKSTQEESGWDQ